MGVLFPTCSLPPNAGGGAIDHLHVRKAKKARDVISGLLIGPGKMKIASARFQSVARRAQYRIFLFRERNVILKSSACLPVFVRSRSDERSRSYSSEKVWKVTEL